MFSSFQGWFGEKMATFGMWLHLDEKVYRRIDNIILPTSNGTTQMDHVIVSVYGIFVIETKNMTGWIFGDKDSPKWTQSIFGKKHQFQNPLRQNYRHTKCLSEYLGINHDFIHSVVFFIGECEFKTDMPDNVMTEGVSSYIEGFSLKCLNPAQVEKIEGKLRTLKENSNLTNEDHLDSLEKRHNPSAPTGSQQCPRCGGKLVERTATNRKYAGTTFMGCSRFPSCKFILSSDTSKSKSKPMSFWDVLTGS